MASEVTGYSNWPRPLPVPSHFRSAPSLISSIKNSSLNGVIPPTIQQPMASQQESAVEQLQPMGVRMGAWPQTGQLFNSRQLVLLISMAYLIRFLIEWVGQSIQAKNLYIEVEVVHRWDQIHLQVIIMQFCYFSISFSSWLLYFRRIRWFVESREIPILLNKRKSKITVTMF